MGKIYKRYCNYCDEYYEGYGKKYCSRLCGLESGTEYVFGNRNKINLGRKQTKESVNKRIARRKNNGWWSDIEKTKIKMSKVQSDHPNYNTGRTWFKNGNKLFLGRKHLKETLNKMSLVKLGKPVSWATGKNNWNWKGGITPVKKKLRDSIKYKQWRDECFQRDNYTCQKCNKQGGKIHSHHHIIPFSKIINSLKQWCDEFKLDLYESALKFEPLWDINNGQTLCINCHEETDTYLKNYSK